MKIDELHIEKFRSFKKCDVRLNEINAIVGENNSGKTAILKALNAFFNYDEEKSGFINGTHRHSNRANTKIIVTFKDIPDNKDYYLDKIDNGKIKIVMKYNYSQNRKTIGYIKNGEEISADDSLIKEIKKDIDYFYVPASRNTYDLKWKENSIFKRLVEEYSKNYTKSRDTVSNHVKRASQHMQKSVLNKIENQLEKLFPINEDVLFSIGYSQEVDYTLLLENLVVELNESGKVYPVFEYGSGIMSLTVISMYRILAEMTGIDIVLGIEEPEMNLHPQMQKQFISSMKQGKQKKEVQMLMTSHSTVIIDELNYDDIILVRRENDPKRGFNSVVTQLPEDFWKRAGSVFKYHQFFDYRNSDFFFSKYVIITESKTDSQVIEKLIKDELGEKMAYISLINLEGVSNIEYPYFLLKELKIPFSCIVDKDFFTDYSNHELEKSRDGSTGFPIYKQELNENNVINNLLPTVQERNELLQVLKTGVYKNVYEFLKKYNFYTMQYCLEMDMVMSKKICEEYYNMLNVMPQDHSSKFLLINKKKAIKKVEYILPILDKIQFISFPNSLKQIKRGLIEDIENVF